MYVSNSIYGSTYPHHLIDSIITGTPIYNNLSYSAGHRNQYRKWHSDDACLLIQGSLCIRSLGI